MASVEIVDYKADNRVFFLVKKYLYTKIGKCTIS